MEQRQISETEVAAIVAAPQWTAPGKIVLGRGPRVHLWGRVNGRLIRVTVATEDELVVSVVAPEEEEL